MCVTDASAQVRHNPNTDNPLDGLFVVCMAVVIFTGCMLVWFGFAFANPVLGVLQGGGCVGVAVWGLWRRHQYNRT